jgi:hypothetical protein
VFPLRQNSQVGGASRTLLRISDDLKHPKGQSIFPERLDSEKGRDAPPIGMKANAGLAKSPTRTTQNNPFMAIYAVFKL